MTYKEAVIEAMGWLGEQPDTIFLGQTVACPGSYMYGSLEKVPMSKRIEMPVAEELQMGMTLGLALEGYVVISIYPRIDFMLLAINQLVNHVDKIFLMSDNRMKPRIIFRTSIGPKTPLDAGVQHTQDHTYAMRLLCKYVEVFRLWDIEEEMIVEDYRNAYSGHTLWHAMTRFPPVIRPISLFVEKGELYAG